LPNTLRSWFDDFSFQSVRLGPSWANAEIHFVPSDKDAAWELYVELLTRTATQSLASGQGDEEAALKSIHSIFPCTREILRHHGRQAMQFSKVAIPILNQVVRPFTDKWHQRSLSQNLSDPKMSEEFRNDLAELQVQLRNYNSMLAEISGVEDFTDLEGQVIC